jgi:RNA polymerase sigma-70 factor (ECF subfamily)
MRQAQENNSQNEKSGEGEPGLPSCNLFFSEHSNRRMSLTMEQNLSHLDDEGLIGRIGEGSHEAFASLVGRHTDKFYRIAYRIVSNKNDAEDIVQEAFLKIWDRPKRWNPRKGAKFTTWFYKVVVNLCFDYNKKKRPLHLPAGIEFEDGHPGQDDLLDAHQKQVVLERCIRELPDRQQLALNLCFYEGLPHDEAARVVGVKVKALQSLLMRAKTTLKEKVSQYVQGDS